MVPTGSTCGQSSPTSARRRARLRLAALGLVLLVAATAHADWRTVSVPGTPREVDVWEPGTFSVATSSHAVLFQDGGLTLQLDGGSFGTALTSEGCFVSVLSSGERVSALAVDGGTPGPCVPSTAIIDDPSNSGLAVHRMKQLPAGPGMAIAAQPGDPFSARVRYSPEGVKGPVGDGPWDEISVENEVISVPPDAFGVTRVDGVDHGLFATRLPSGGLVWIQKGGPTTALSTPSTTVVQVVKLSPLGSGLAPYAVFGSGSGIFRGMLQGLPNDYTAAVVPEGLSNISGLDVNLDPDSGVQGSFGMAVVQLPDGGHGVLSALPHENRAQAGSEWRLNPTPLPPGVASADLEEIACASARYCVITVNRNGGENLLIYTNEHRPVLSVANSVEIGEESSTDLPVFASDDDGDAVRVTWIHPGGNSPAWTLSQVPSEVGEDLRLRITGGSVCQDTVVSSAADGGLVIRAIDGRPEHEVKVPIEVTVKHTQVPAPPQVSPSQPRIAAGSASPLVLTATGVATSAGCLPTGFRWKALTDGGTVQEGSTLAFHPPRHVCDAAGVDFDYQLEAYDSAGTSAPTPFSVHVEPWGPPEPAFGADAGVSVTAGEPLFFGPQALHVCQGTAGFPGVETTWSLAPGTTPPQGLEFLATDGGVVGLPVQAGVLGVRSPACVDARFRLSAENRLQDAGSPASEVEVTVVPRMRPLASGELSLQVEQPTVGELALSVNSDLDCPGRRGLYADLRLERVAGGSEPVSGSLSVPGSVRLPLPAGCRGERFRVTGTMREDGGTDFVEKSWEVEADSRGLPVALEPLPPEVKLVARCGEGARVMLTQTFPEGTCSNPLVTWTQLEGPSLEQDSLSGHAVELATRDTELDALVGQSVVLRVTASEGPGNEVTREHRVPITAAPFIQVRRRAELPAAADTTLVGVSVELLNTTACGVKDVRFLERLEGLTYVPGSARFDGVPVEAGWQEGILTVEGLALEGQGSGVLSYVARPLLLGERRMSGEALLRGIPISQATEPGPRAPVSGCGCSGAGGPGTALLALGALLASVRRRRR